MRHYFNTLLALALNYVDTEVWVYPANEIQTILCITNYNTDYRQHCALHTTDNALQITDYTQYCITNYITDYRQHCACLSSQPLVSGIENDCKSLNTQRKYPHPPGNHETLLYILYTDDCRSNHLNRFRVKCADDSALLSLLQGSERYHGPALTEFVDWCDNSYLDLNVTETKEMIVDFRRQEHSPGNTIIKNNEVEIVSKYKYLGTIFDDNLRWDYNNEEIVKKGQQRMYLLRNLNYFSVDQKILTLFLQILY